MRDLCVISTGLWIYTLKIRIIHIRIKRDPPVFQGLHKHAVVFPWISQGANKTWNVITMQGDVLAQGFFVVHTLTHTHTHVQGEKTSHSCTKRTERLVSCWFSFCGPSLSLSADVAQPVQARIQNFGQGGQHSFDPNGGGPWAQNVLKMGVFPLNFPENCMIWNKSLG